MAPVGTIDEARAMERVIEAAFFALG